MIDKKSAIKIFKKNKKRNSRGSHRLEGVTQFKVSKKKGQTMDEYIEEVVKTHVR